MLSKGKGELATLQDSPVCLWGRISEHQGWTAPQQSIMVTPVGDILGCEHEAARSNLTEAPNASN